MKSNLKFILTGVLLPMMLITPFGCSLKANDSSEKNKIMTIKKSNPQKQERKTLISQLIKGKKIKSSNETYTFLPELKSAKKIPSGISSKQQPLSQNGVDSQGVLDKKGAYLFFRYQQADTETVDVIQNIKSTDQITLYPVVFNERTSQFGIVLGTIEVKYNKYESPQSIAEDHGLILHKNFTRLGIAYFKTNKTDIFDAAESLLLDKRVIKAEVEILENINEPQ